MDFFDPWKAKPSLKNIHCSNVQRGTEQRKKTLAGIATDKPSLF